MRCPLQQHMRDGPRFGWRGGGYDDEAVGQRIQQSLFIADPLGLGYTVRIPSYKEPTWL